MRTLGTTKLSSKGQVVIPEVIRKSLKLHTGDNFVALAERDIIVLKLMTTPALEGLDSLIERARKSAKKAKLKKKDVKTAIKEARKYK